MRQQVDRNQTIEHLLINMPQFHKKFLVNEMNRE